MCTGGSKNNVWLSEATGMDAICCDISTEWRQFCSVWTVEGVVGPHGDTMKSWRFCSYDNFEKTPFALAYLAVRGAIAFPSI